MHQKEDFYDFFIHRQKCQQINKGRISILETDTTLLLYTISTEKSPLLGANADFQVYPGGYDDVKLLVSGDTSNEVSSFEVAQGYAHVSHLQLKKFEVMTIQVSNNGYLSAGGIWQVLWSSEKKRPMLREICAAGIDVVEVATLLSAEEIHQVEQAIRSAQDFWDEKMPGVILMLVGCEEIRGDTLERHRHPSAEDRVPWQQVEKTWRMVFHEFGTREKPHRMVVRTVLVHYHPEREEDPFTVERL